MSWLGRVRQHPLYQFPDFRNFFIGDTLVAVAERYFAITFAWWVVSGDGENGARLGILMALEAVPILLLAPFVGPLIDRYDKKLCMLTGVIMQLVFLMVIGWLMASGQLTFVLLCLFSFLMSCFVPQFEDSISASLPRLVDEEHLPSATTIQSSTVELSNIFAAVISTSVIAAFGITTAVMVNMGLYGLGILFLYLIKTDLSPEREEEEEDHGYLHDLKEGLRYIRSNRPLYLFMAVYCFETFFVAPLFLLIPLLVKNVLHETVSWVAVFETALSIGSVLTALTMSFRNHYPHYYKIYGSALACTGGAFVFLGTTGSPHGMAAAVFVTGCLYAMMMALAYMLFQTEVPDQFKGRFFGVVSTVTAGMSPLAFMSVGFLSDFFSTGMVLLIDGAGLIVLSAILFFIPRVREEIGSAEA